ncbi:hypothetical protein [Pararhodonellum marinum]|uniref:hypothetical protein n=1 Tax=Pararhodonellum marinum TaxID=2755358 RepID=UPI00188E881D|nr:hypothetical protein [Pararhodonellum marinum]
MLVTKINQPRYFSSKDLDHIREQLILSEEVAKRNRIIDLNDSDLTNKGDKISVWYNFYVPIFNLDSSAVYVQYDYNENVYGEGNGAVLIRKEDRWELLVWLDRWMT